MLQVDIGAGKRVLPSGMITSSARNEPSLTGSSGPVSALDGNRLAGGYGVPVEGSRGLVDAIGELRHHVAALRLGLVEDARDRLENGIAAVFAEQLVHAPRREPAGRPLRLPVAERGFRKTDVVPEHAIERLVELARFVDL